MTIDRGTGRSMVVALLGVGALLLAGGCSALDERTVRGSGELVTIDHDLAGFDRLEARRGIDVRLGPSGRFEVLVTADDNVHEYLEVERLGSTLRLDVDDAVNLVEARTSVVVAMPEVRGLVLHAAAMVEIVDLEAAGVLEARLTGGSELECGGIAMGTFALDLSGGSDVRCRGLDVDAVVASLDGGSTMSLGGSTATMQLTASGGSTARLDDLRSAGAEIQLSGGSDASLRVSGVLEAELRSGSSLRYAGDPVVGATDISEDSHFEPAE